MIKQAGTAGYVSISGRKIAAILLILICSLALAWATRSGKGNKSDTSVKPAQPLVAHANHAPMGGRPVSPATHNHSKAVGKAHKHHRQGALSNFNAPTPQPSGARHSKGAGQGANQGAGQGANRGAGGGGGGGSGSGADQGAGQGAKQRAGHGANPKSDATPTPTPEENLSPTSDTTLGSSLTTGTSRWPRAAATPAP
jgi:hypothetical protein